MMFAAWLLPRQFGEAIKKCRRERKWPPSLAVFSTRFSPLQKIPADTKPVPSAEGDSLGDTPNLPALACRAFTCRHFVAGTDSAPPLKWAGFSFVKQPPFRAELLGKAHPCGIFPHPPAHQTIAGACHAAQPRLTWLSARCLSS